MKRNRYIHLWAVGWMLLFVASLTSCRDDDAGTPQAKMRTISLNFPAIQPYTASRADNDVNAIDGESTFHTADIWVFDSNNADDNATAAAYKRIEDAERYTTASGELRTELTIPEEITTVDIYVITNGLVTGLDANSTRSALQSTTFSNKPNNETSSELTNNGLLMSRIITGIPVAKLSGSYDANTQLPLERGVAKIACFFAKESESTQAEITSITVSGATDRGSVFPAAVTFENKDTRPSAANVPAGVTNTETVPITPPSAIQVLAEDATLARGDEEDAQNYVTRLNQIASSTNDYYLFEADANDMTVTIQYTLGTAEVKTATVKLDKDVIRNHYVVITGTVKGGILELEYLALQWENVSSVIGWNATPIVAAWNSDDYDAPNLTNATVGDEEAAYCYVVYPRYDNDEHTILETDEYDNTKPSYAGFYFKLDAPDGAVWKAHLEEPDGNHNFRFGTGQYRLEDNGPYERFCVTTGIAREEPYQIQITATHAWTDAKFNNLVWGNQVEESGEEIYAEFYITVSLDGVEEHELVINPKNVATNTHWLNGRRFAGTDTRIYIWQFKATNGDNFTQIVKNILQDNPTHTISQFWDPDSPANNEN
ncbi:hypothetical protein [Bacteroides sp. An51A]|uniref:hypothetical protein n=1 Tax=Bacteroides sp. An51A TaxID=1965640 RepID=UPI000B366E95|nr:hypothetical protein [Bacteroides sp. An51A]OUN80734.1 hypothetical protein B5G04_10400 [Bacteroides sp. An51A]